MRQLKEIKRRMVNTRQIRRVTGTLQRVSAARLPADRRAVENSSLYAEKLSALVRNLYSVAPETDHPYARGAAGGSALVVVFGSERGLCGGFNSNLVSRFSELAGEHGDRAVRAVCVGKIVNRRLRRAGAAVDLFIPQPASSRRGEIIDRMVEFIDEGFGQGVFGTVDLLYNRSVSAFRQEPTVERLLPLAPAEAGDGAFRLSCFEPEPGRILRSLLPEYVRQLLDNVFLRSVEAEDAARQAAMSRATENAGKILENLRRQYSRQRQENITTEMIELAGGGAAHSRAG